MKIQRRLIRLAAAVSLALPFSPAALAADLDSPLRVWVGYPPGGSADRVARAVSAHLEKEVGVPVIVENRSGAGGRVAAQAFINTDPKENILMVANPAVMVVAPEVFDNVGYDPLKDIKPVSLVAGYRFGLAASENSDIKSAQDLAKWVAENPRAFNVGVPGTGSLPHFFALMLAQDLGQEVEVIGYRGSAPLVTDLIGGQVPLAVDTLDSQLPQHQAGKLRILASSGAARETDLPDVPTFKEVGIDVEADGWFGFFAPAKMPDAKRIALSEDIARALQGEELQKTLRQLGYEPLVMDAAKSEAAIDAYRAQWVPVVKDSGYRAEQ